MNISSTFYGLLILSLMTSVAEAASRQALKAKVEHVEAGAPTPSSSEINREFGYVNFAPGKSDLSDNAKTTLTTFFNAQNVSSRDLRINIAGYADYPYPLADASTVTPESIALAKRRIEAVTKQIKDYGAFASIKTFNMAQPVSLFDKLFASDKKEITEGLAGQSVEDFELNKVATVLKHDGRAGRVVIIAIPNATALAH